MATTDPDIEKIIRRGIRRGMEILRKRTLRRLYTYSSGPYSSKELRALHHPYATRHGAPMLNPSRINVQGVQGVREEWKASVAFTELTFENDHPIYQRFLRDGTHKMFRRGGIETDVRDELNQVSDSVLEQCIMEELEKYSS